MNKSTSLIAFAIGSLSSVTHAAEMHPACKGVKLPTNTIKVILPAEAGNSSDTAARTITHAISEKYGPKFVIENVAGASGIIGGNRAKKEVDVDGNTLMFAQAPDVSVNPHVESFKKPYSRQDFKAISYVAAMPYVLICNKAKTPGINTIDDLAKYLKERDVSISVPANAPSGPNTTKAPAVLGRKGDDPHMFMADGGSTNITHVASVRLASSMKTPSGSTGFIRVPYKGTSGAMNDVAGGHVDCMFQSLASADGYINHAPGDKSSLIKAIGVTKKTEHVTPKGNKIPPISASEAGKEFGELYNWVGFFGHPQMKPELANCFNAMVRSAMADPKVESKLKAKGFLKESTDPQTPEEFGKFVDSELVRMKPTAETIDKLMKGGTNNDSRKKPGTAKGNQTS